MRTTHTPHVLALAALLLAAGLAQAGPNSLYYAGIDPTWGTTLEDDGAVVHAPGSPLDGLENRVTLNGAAIGNGRFLDARVAPRASDMHLYAGAYAAPLTGHPNLLLPGSVAAAAWYGEWNDLERDGYIHDLPDGTPGDEFTWRGKASGHGTIPMALYVNPVVGISFAICNCLRFHGWADAVEKPVDHYVDNTNTNEPHWFTDGRGNWAIIPGNYDGGFLATTTHITVAEAIQVQGSAVRYDLNDPDAVVDVDVYEALDSDVEILWSSVLRTLKPEVLAFDKTYRDTASFLNQGPNAIADMTTRPAIEEANFILQPKHPREPNHPLDEYMVGMPLAFMGAGDVLGTGNTYPGYASEPHFFVDADARMGFRPAVDLDLRPLGIHTHIPAQNQDPVFHYEPTPDLDESRSHKRNPTTIFAVTVTMFAWHDRNGDGYIGWMCDTSNPEEWDAERNVCYAAEGMYGQPRGDSTGDRRETRAGLCYGSDLRTVTAWPLGGSWPGALLVRDHERYSRVVWDQHWEVLTGTEPVELEWRPCLSTSGTRTADILVFPAGSPTVPIMTRVEITSGEYEDEDGIRQPGGDTIVDVDVYWPTL